jgi:hypothetical protein
LNLIGFVYNQFVLGVKNHIQGVGDEMLYNANPRDNSSRKKYKIIESATPKKKNKEKEIANNTETTTSKIQ